MGGWQRKRNGGRARGKRRGETRGGERREGGPGRSKGEGERRGRKKFNLELYLEEGPVQVEIFAFA